MISSDSFKGSEVFQPIINGIGGNLVSVHASRMSTTLHQSSIMGILPPNSKICVFPWTALFVGCTYNFSAIYFDAFLARLRGFFPYHWNFQYTVLEYIRYLKIFFSFTNSAVFQDREVAPRLGDPRSADLRLHRRRFKSGRLQATRLLRNLLYSRFLDTSKSRIRSPSILTRGNESNESVFLFPSGDDSAIRRASNYSRHVEAENRSRQLGDPLLDGTR